VNITFPVLPKAVAKLMQDPFLTPGGILYHSTNEPSCEPLYRARFPPPPAGPTHVAPIQMPTAHRQTTLVFTKAGGNPSLRDAIQVGWRSFELPTDAAQAVGSRLIHEKGANDAELEEFVVGPHAEASLRLYLSLKSKFAPVGEPQFEFIFMLIPCLYVATVWLHGKDGQNFFYPLQPATFYRPPAFEQPATPIGGVPAKQYFEETQYFAEISKLMQRRHF
jgi:hypothetical protein